MAALFFLLTGTALAQDSQFFFDSSGNLFAETSETSGLPQIIGQPQMQVVVPDESASFSVSVADTSGVSYQWYFNSSVIPGATGDSLLLTNVSMANQGPYFVAVSNSVGSVASVLANLYIDSRGCGMPDSWQLQYFGTLNQPATGDYDGDGVSNLQEFLDGTNPTNAASALYRITLLNDGGSVVISPDQPTYTNGQIVTLTATSTNSSPFHAWTGDVVTRSDSITVTMNTNLTLFARFLPFTLVWTNSQSGDWNVAANWLPSLIPSSNESVLIDNQATVTENSNVDLVDFTLGNSETTAGLAGSGIVTIAGMGFWYNGTMSGGGRTVVKPGAYLSMPNSLNLGMNNRTLENAGVVVWVGGNFALGGVITNDPGAQFEITGPASLNYGGGTARFDNAGTFITASNAATSFAAGVSFNNYGTVNFGGGGTLTMSGGGIQAAPIAVPAGSAIIFAGGIFSSTSNLSLTGLGALIVGAGTTATLAGTVNLAGSNIFAGGGVDFTGNYTCTNNTMLFSGGSASLNGTGVVSPAILTINANGTLDGTQNVTVLDAMTWTGGSMTGTGRTIIPPSVILSISNASPIIMTSRTLDNAGTVIWNGAGTMSGSAAVITNEPGALFQIQGPQLASFGNSRFDNAGILRITGSGTTSFSGSPVNNFNLVDIQGGTLDLSGGGTHSGAITVPAGTAINLGGPFTSTSGSSITRAGQLIVSGGSSTVAGTVNVTGSNIFTAPGSVDFTGNYICTNNSILISGGIASFDGTGLVSPAFVTLGGSGTLGGAQNVTVLNAMNWTSGGMTGTGRTIIPPGVTLSISNTSFVSITSRTLDNAGTTIWNGTASMSVSAGVITNEPGALFQIQGPQSESGTARFDNAGTLRITGSGTTSLVGVNNFNLVNIQGGTLALTGSGTNSGTMNVPSGTAINLSGPFTSTSGSFITGAGQLIVSGGPATLAGTVNVTGSNIFGSTGNVDFTGNYICTNNSISISGASASFDGTGVVSPAFLTLNVNGTLGGAQNVTIGNAMTWLGGNMSGTGRIIIPSGATLTTSNGSPVIITSRTLDNSGTVVWTGAGTVSMTGGVITNRASGLFNAQNSVFWTASSSRFDNVGTFRKSVNAGTMTFDGVNFTNYGTVDIQSGTLASASGGYGSASNAVLNCAIAGKIPGTNYGRLQVTGAVTLSGSLSVNLTGSYIPATNDSFTLVTAGTRNGTFSKFIYPSNQISMVLSNTATSVIATITNVLASYEQPILYLAKFSTNSGILYWATNFPSYFLEYNTSLSTTNWAASALTPVIVGTNFVVTNALSSAQKYYRLSSVPATYTPRPPALNIQTVSPGLVRFLWPIDDDRPFSLQSTTNLPATNWSVVTSSPQITGTNDVVTNTVTGKSQFFRLSNH